MSSFAVKILGFILFLFSFYLWWLVSWSFYERERSGREYVPVGCGMMSDRVSDEVNACCDDRSSEYFAGGNRQERRTADREFRMCVKQSATIEDPRYLGVYFYGRDVLSPPYVHTPLRWGNGWAYGKGYRDR